MGPRAVFVNLFLGIVARWATAEIISYTFIPRESLPCASIPFLLQQQLQFKGQVQGLG